MVIGSKHPSMMRVAVISASRTQRESLKNLIEENGPRVIGTGTIHDYMKNHADLRPDVLLVDLEHASDEDVERISQMMAKSTIPVLFNESPLIPTMPGPYRDDWTNNLLGKLVDLTVPGSHTRQRGILHRPRFVQSANFRFPRVLVLSHSKTRRRVLELILINQGFQETHEAAFDFKYASSRPGAVDVILADEHNVGEEEQKAFNAIMAQTTVPTLSCDSTQIPTAAGERKLWGQKLAAQILQLHKKKNPAAKMEGREFTPRIVAAPPPRDSDDIARETEAAHWGDRMALKLAQLRKSIKTNHDDFMSDARPIASASAEKNKPASPKKKIVTAPSDTPIDQPAPRKTASIVQQVTSHIEEAQHESALMQERITRELERDLKSPPEAASVVNHIPDAHDEPPRKTSTAKPELKSQTIPLLDLVDATNLDQLPRTSLPREINTSSEEMLARQRSEQIERFFELNEKMKQADEARLQKFKENAANHPAHEPQMVDHGAANPFSNKRTPKVAAKITVNGARPKPATKVKGYRPKSTLSRIINSLHDFQKLIPKIFN